MHVWNKHRSIKKQCTHICIISCLSQRQSDFSLWPFQFFAHIDEDITYVSLSYPKLEITSPYISAKGIKWKIGSSVLCDIGGPLISYNSVEH